MSKLHRLIIFILCLSVGMGMVSSKQLYVYTSSKGILSFDSRDILSIDYVPEGSDMPAMQNFVTPDSTYSIPVSEINYVGFKTPETEYNGNVNLTATLSEYVYGANELTLLLNGATPRNLIPKSGEVIYLESSEESELSLPFAGRVNSITEQSDTLYVACDPVKLSDIFKTYYGVFKSEETNNVASDDVRRRAPAHGVFKPSPIRFGVAEFLNHKEIDDISLSSEARWDEVISPVFHYDGYCIVDPDYGTSIAVDVITDITIEDIIRLGGSVNVSKDIKLFSKKLRIPSALMELYFEVGLTAQASGEISGKITNTHNYRHVFHYDWSSTERDASRSFSRLRNTGNSHEGYWTINGNLSAGAYVELGVGVIFSTDFDIAKADVHFEAGLQTQGNWVPSKREAQNAMTSTAYYNRMSESSIGTDIYTSGEAELHLFGWSPSYDGGILSHCNNFFPWQQVGLVPEFDDMKAEAIDYNSINVSTSATGNTLPCDIGLAIVNQKTKKVTKIYRHHNYSGPATGIAYNFDNLDPGSYEVYPLVKSMEVEMIASPHKQVSLYPITGSYTCVWYTTPPNAKLLSMELREDNTMTQTYYYANREENVTYNATYSFDGEILTFYKSNGDVQNWEVVSLDEHNLVICQSDGFTYYLEK